MERIVEICCGSYYDAKNAYLGKAKRIELNSALYLGGLTPSAATLRQVKKDFDLEIICMVRPRGAGFCYNDEDFLIMKEEAKDLLENGADGIAFGILDQDGNIDLKRNQEIIEIIKSYHKTAVFHRAFDCVKDYDQAIRQLIDLGVDRVLTSGLEAKAMDGKEVIKYLQSHYGDQIQILAGSGMNASNAKEMMDHTGIYQVHSSCKDWLNDPTTSSNHVTYAYATSPHENDYEIVSKELVEKLVASI